MRFENGLRFFRGFGACAAIAASLAFVAPAEAVTFAGTTEGCFGASCTNFTSSAVQSGLTFTGGNFSVGGAGSSIGIGGLTNNLGTFTLSGVPATYTGDFSLEVLFTSPINTAITFVDTLSGTVASAGNGGVTVTFSSISQSFDGGLYTLTLNPVSVTGGDANDISGTIQINAVPEASTWAMIIMGFLGVGFMAYRNKKGAPAFRFA
jgi:hypothetical protein